MKFTLVETYRIRNYILVDQVFTQTPHHFDLLFDRQARNRHLYHTAHTRIVRRNETLVVHVRQGSHDELAIHPICYASVSWDRVTEIFDLESAFYAAGEESTEWSDE